MQRLGAACLADESIWSVAIPKLSSLHHHSGWLSLICENQVLPATRILSLVIGQQNQTLSAAASIIGILMAILEERINGVSDNCDSAIQTGNHLDRFSWKLLVLSF